MGTTKASRRARRSRSSRAPSSCTATSRLSSASLAALASSSALSRSFCTCVALLRACSAAASARAAATEESAAERSARIRSSTYADIDAFRSSTSLVTVMTRARSRAFSASSCLRSFSPWSTCALRATVSSIALFLRFSRTTASSHSCEIVSVERLPFSIAALRSLATASSAVESLPTCRLHRSSSARVSSSCGLYHGCE